MKHPTRMTREAFLAFNLRPGDLIHVITFDNADVTTSFAAIYLRIFSSPYGYDVIEVVGPSPGVTQLFLHNVWQLFISQRVERCLG